MLMASSVNVFPDVTACDELRAPEAITVSVAFVSAQWVAVPVPVTEPAVIAGTITLRPSVAPASVAPVFTVSFPSVLPVTVAYVSPGSVDVISIRVPLVSA